MKFWLINSCALMLIMVTAGVHGHWTYRWRTFDRDAVTASLERVPMGIGDWVGRDAAEDDISTWRDEMDLGQVRRYTHRLNGTTVLVMVRGGPPGPIGRHHTPASCYNAVGFGARGPDVRRPLADSSGARHAFWVSDFEKPGVAPQRVRVYWGYSGGAGWDAPTNPRVDLSGFDVCYKLYVVRNLGESGEPLDDDRCETFLRDALPVLNAALFPAPRS